MTLEEKIKFIEEHQQKNYVLFSPITIRNGETLVSGYETLELYENMDKNTKKFAEKEIVNLISNAKYNNKETKNYLNFRLYFCGDFSDLPNDIGMDFIMNNKEKIVAEYKYVKGTEQREFFIGFVQSETIYNYGYLYLNLAKLLEEFEKNNISYKIDTTVDESVPYLCIDDAETKFVISYNPEKEKGHQLKKVRKEI